MNAYYNRKSATDAVSDMTLTITTTFPFNQSMEWKMTEQNCQRVGRNHKEFVVGVTTHDITEKC